VRQAGRLPAALNRAGLWQDDPIRTIALAMSQATHTAGGVSWRFAEQRRAQAVANRDATSLRKLISGDYYHVESGGRARTKIEFLQLLSRDQFAFRSYEIDDMEIRLLDNGRAAPVTRRFRAEMQGANRLRGRYVRSWVLGPDGWRNTMQQSTEIRPLASQRDAKALR
jgi:hypothetical protein